MSFKDKKKNDTTATTLLLDAETGGQDRHKNTLIYICV